MAQTVETEHGEKEHIVREPVRDEDDEMYRSYCGREISGPISNVYTDGEFWTDDDPRPIEADKDVLCLVCMTAYDTRQQRLEPIVGEKPQVHMSKEDAIEKLGEQMADAILMARQNGLSDELIGSIWGEFHRAFIMGREDPDKEPIDYLMAYMRRDLPGGHE